MGRKQTLYQGLLYAFLRPQNARVWGGAVPSNRRRGAGRTTRHLESEARELVPNEWKNLAPFGRPRRAELGRWGLS